MTPQIRGSSFPHLELMEKQGKGPTEGGAVSFEGQPKLERHGRHAWGVSESNFWQNQYIISLDLYITSYKQIYREKTNKSIKRRQKVIAIN